jgi:hypothetical protein
MSTAHSIIRKALVNSPVLSEQHLYHHDFEPLPFVVVFTTQRTLLLHHALSTSGDCEVVVSWTRKRSHTDVRGPHDRLVQLKRVIGEELKREGSAGVVNRVLSRATATSGPAFVQPSLKECFVILEAEFSASCVNLARLPLESPVCRVARVSYIQLTVFECCVQILDVPGDVIRLLTLLGRLESLDGNVAVPATLYLRFLAVFSKTIALLKQLSPDADPDVNVHTLVRTT